MPANKAIDMSDAALKKALEPFLRAYRVSLEPFPQVPDAQGLRDSLPGVWPTVGNLRVLFDAAIKAGMDYDQSK